MRIRVQFMAAFTVLALISAYLGLNRNLQFEHDKLLHGGMFFAMALSFYWVLDTHRRRCIQLTAAGIGGVFGIGSEFVQALAVPTRSFDVFDIVANLVGTCLAIWLCSWYHARLLERKRQARFELLRSSTGATNQGGSTSDAAAAAAAAAPSTTTPENTV